MKSPNPSSDRPPRAPEERPRSAGPSRRSALQGAGLVVVGAAAGIPSGCQAPPPPPPCPMSLASILL